MKRGNLKKEKKEKPLASRTLDQFHLWKSSFQFLRETDWPVMLVSKNLGRGRKRKKKKRGREKKKKKEKIRTSLYKNEYAGKNANVKTLANGGGMERNRGQRERVVRRILQDVWPASSLTKGTSKRGRWM